MARKPRPRISEDFFDETFGAADGAAPAATDSARTSENPRPMAVVGSEIHESKASAIEAPRAGAERDNSRPHDKIRTTLYISRELYEQARWMTLNFPDHARSVSQLMESALRAEVARITEAKGTPVGRHVHGLPGGRPKQAS